MNKRHHSIHKRVALHPLTAMVLLCLGVFLVGMTFRAAADTLDVTATVHAAPLTTPPVITSHYDQQHVSDAQADVAGTCPADSYVKLFNNNVFSGVAPCQSGTFTMPTVFTSGPNALQAKAYNSTDDEGPFNPAITVYFDNAAVTPQIPPNVPSDLSVQTVDGAQFRTGRTMAASTTPTITGFAPPNSAVTITMQGVAQVCRTTARESGWWACTFHDALSLGRQGVAVSAKTVDGRALSFPLFYIQVSASQQPLVPESGDILPLRINTTYRYVARYEGQNWQWDANVEGGTPPYKITIEWGDGTTSNRDRSDSEYFTISHIYDKPGTYRPLIRVIDSDGASNRLAVLQLLAIVKPSSGAPMSSSTTPASGIPPYLMVAWPVYGAIFLMVVSFWLGEMEIARKLRLRRH